MTTRSPTIVALTRGLTKRCARCGSGNLFTGWFRMLARCPRCHLRFEREPGYWVGAVAVNLAVVGAVFAIVLVVALAATVPDVPVPAVLALTVPIVAIGPIVFYPFSKTLWVAVDRSIRRHLD